MMHVRVCRDCGEQYRPEIARCSDCGGELADRYEDAGGSAVEAGASVAAADPGEPRLETVGLFWSLKAQDLVSLADPLVAAGIAVQIVARPGGDEERPRGFELRVRPEDQAAARVALAAVLEAGTLATPLRGREAAFPPETGEAHCPACSAELRPGIGECPDCGLGLGAPGEADEPGG